MMATFLFDIDLYTRDDKKPASVPLNKQINIVINGFACNIVAPVGSRPSSTIIITVMPNVSPRVVANAVPNIAPPIIIGIKLSVIGIPTKLIAVDKN